MWLFFLWDIKYIIIDDITFLNTFKKSFIIQTCCISDEDDNIHVLRQIKKSEIQKFNHLVTLFKRCIKDFFIYNPLNEGFFNISRECPCCDEKKILFKKFYREEYICEECYQKIRTSIQIIYNNILFEKNKKCSKQDLYDTCYQSIQGTYDKYNLPIKYSYSITCYKSQGSSYNCVVVDYKNIYNCNEQNLQNLTRSMYVSFSRTQNKLCIMDYFRQE